MKVPVIYYKIVIKALPNGTQASLIESKTSGDFVSKVDYDFIKAQACLFENKFKECKEGRASLQKHLCKATKDVKQLAESKQQVSRLNDLVSETEQKLAVVSQGYNELSEENARLKARLAEFESFFAQLPTTEGDENAENIS